MSGVRSMGQERLRASHWVMHPKGVVEVMGWEVRERPFEHVDKHNSHVPRQKVQPQGPAWTGSRKTHMQMLQRKSGTTSPSNISGS